MAGEKILCAGCGITLMPFMKACPMCGLERTDAAPLDLQPPAESLPPFAGSPSTPEEKETATLKTAVVPLDAIRQKPGFYDEAEFAPTRNVVLLSPNETKRRFPLFTRAQLTLLIVGVALILLLVVVGILLWRQQQREILRSANAATAKAELTNVPAPSPSPSPSPSPGNDQAIFDSVKLALAAYNPLGFARYNFEVKDGVVTLNGEAEHQPEKDGAENVVRLLAGVTSVVNNLQIKAPPAGEAVKLNPAEAKILNDALARQLQEKENQPASFAPTPTPTPDPQREAERLRREQLAAKQREEDAATRKAAEEKLKREAEEYEKRLEEQRRVEAERRARAEQARTEAASLRYGTIAWNGIVDGTDEIIFSGSSASVRHLNGNPPREIRASFSAPMPRSPMEVKLIWLSGRGFIDIIQQPSAANGYTTIVRVDDSAKGGDKRYEFTLRWSLLQ